MTRLQEQIETTLPIDDVFAFIADFANSMAWDPGTATSERMDAGPVGVGARYRLGVRMRGRVVPMEYRITAFEPPRRVVLHGSGSGISAVDIRLGGLMRLVQPFLGRAFAKIAHDALDGMRRALDARAALVGAATAGQRGSRPLDDGARQ